MTKRTPNMNSTHNKHKKLNTTM